MMEEVEGIKNEYKLVYYSSKRNEFTLIRYFEKDTDKGRKIMMPVWQNDFQGKLFISKEVFLEMYDCYLGKL